MHMLKATRMLVTMANRHVVYVESFLSPSSLMHSSTSGADTSTQLLFYHTTHITLLRPFHVAAGSANWSYSNLPSVSSTSFSSLVAGGQHYETIYRINIHIVALNNKRYMTALVNHFYCQISSWGSICIQCHKTMNC